MVFTPFIVETDCQDAYFVKDVSVADRPDSLCQSCSSRVWFDIKRLNGQLQKHLDRVCCSTCACIN